MPQKISIILLCCVAIVVAALFTVTQLMAEEKLPPFDKYQAVTKSNEIEVAGLRKKYSRKDNGCVESVAFYNDQEKCLNNEECRYNLKQEWDKCMQDEACKPKLDGITWPPAPVNGWLEAILTKKDPVIWGEKLVGAGSTKGESDICGDWRFTVAGSPGWDCDVSGGGGQPVCSCIGTYYGPPDWPAFDHCCDPNACVRTP